MYKKAAPFQSETKARYTARRGPLPTLAPSSYDETFAAKIKTLISRLDSQLDGAVDIAQIAKGTELHDFLNLWHTSENQNHASFETFPSVAAPLFKRLCHHNYIRKGKGGLWIVNIPQP